MIIELQIYFFLPTSNFQLPTFLAQIAMEIILKKNCIFSCPKRATAGSSFFGLEKNNCLKNLEMESWIGFDYIL
jgi:hypothetical protein